jgi:DNA-binding LacI/PurR family transcriptional regulator
MAIGAMTAIREAGLYIPEDIAVVGYDDVRVSRFACPPLTTVRAPEVELGRRAATVLLGLINNTLPAEPHTKLQGELIIRESCGMNQRSKS